MHDALTGLYNRNAYDHMRLYLDMAQNALLLVDVDKFKTVNVCKAVGVAYQGTHAARASMCTNLLGNLSDVGVQHQMGHSDIATTRKYYQRFKTSVKEMREKMNNLIQY